MAKKALIIVDIQNDYFPGGKWTLEGMEAASANAARLLEAARAAGTLVIHVHHESLAENAPFFVPGTSGAEIHSCVLPKDGERQVLKHQVNAFRDTNLKDILDQNGVEEVTICGAMSHMCIDAATRAAADFGYGVTLVHDACASRDVEFDGVQVPAEFAHAAFMAALGAAYAKTVSTEHYLKGLAEAA